MKIRSIKQNIILNMIYTVFNIVFPLITFPYVSRILSVDNMGKVTFFTSIANYAIMVASLGISTYGIRMVAKKRDNKEELTRVTHELFIINLISTIVIIVGLTCSILFIDKFKNEFVLLFANFLYILSAPFGLNWFYSGLEQYSYITKRTIFFKLLSLIFIFLFVKTKDDYIVYAFISIITYIITYMCNFIYAKNFISYKHVAKKNFRQHFKPMIILFASILAINIYTHLDTIMLGFINGDKEVGLYTVSVYVKTALLSLVNAISIVILPRVSYYFEKEDTQKLNYIIKKTSTIILMMSIPIAIFFIINARESVLILAGEEYLPATLCMQIIMPVLLFSSLSNITGNQILIPLGKDSCFMKAVISGALFDIIFNLFLMPKYGSVGAAIATLLAEFVQMSIQFYFAKQYVLPNIDIKSISKIIIATIITTIVLLFLKQLIFYHVFINIVIFAMVYFGIYLLLLIVLQEKNILEYINNIKEKLRKEVV